MQKYKSIWNLKNTVVLEIRPSEIPWCKDKKYLLAKVTLCEH